VVMSNLQDAINFNILVTVILCVNIHHIVLSDEHNWKLVRSKIYHYVTHINIYRQTECLNWKRLCHKLLKYKKVKN